MKYDKNRLIITILVLVLLVISLLVINFKKNNSDALKFKKEYEALNGKKAYKNYTYPSIKISSNNSFYYSTEDEIIDVLKKGTGIIYFGFESCPWCRNAVNVLQKVNIDKIYYLNIKDLRDEYKLENKKLVKTKEGSKKYKTMLKLLDSILDDYILTDEDKKEYNTNEKRIYVPLVVGVLNGNIVGYHMDTVDLKDNQSPYDLLSIKQQEKLKNIYDEIVNAVYSSSCDIENPKGC